MAITREHCIEAIKKANGNKTEAAKALGISRSTLRSKVGNTIGKEAETLNFHEEHRLKKENRELRRKLDERAEQFERDANFTRFLSKLVAAESSPPKWLAPKSSRRQERAIVTAVLSDCHFDEVVNPEEINYVNGYNREIAVMRLRNFFSNTVRLSSDYISGVKVDGIVLPMIGDMVSGNIHEELRETNEDTIIETCLFYADQLIAGFELLAKHFGEVYSPCVVGNHGRLDKKPRAKHRSTDSFDYLIYNLVARHFKGNPAVRFAISTGADFRYTLYNTRYQLTHGDQFRGGSGIAGLLSPLMLGDHRKRKREQATGTPYDYLVMGHWHQLAYFKGLIVNGSLKGYDEHAALNNLDFEPPRQAFWLTDSEHGMTITAPIHVLDPSEEWRAQAPEAVRFVLAA